MKKSFLFVILFLLLLFTPTVSAVERCKDVYCYDFQWICCGEEEEEASFMQQFPL